MPGRASAVGYPIFACPVCHSDGGISSLNSVLENMCGQGTTVGGDFSELRGIIDKVRDKTRVGVCLDTCHAFAAGEPHLPFVLLPNQLKAGRVWREPIPPGLDTAILKEQFANFDCQWLMWICRLWPGCWPGSEGHAWWVWSGGGSPLPQSHPSQWLQRYIQDLHAKLSPPQTTRVGSFSHQPLLTLSARPQLCRKIGLQSWSPRRYRKGLHWNPCFPGHCQRAQTGQHPSDTGDSRKVRKRGADVHFFYFQIHLNHDWC